VPNRRRKPRGSDLSVWVLIHADSKRMTLAALFEGKINGERKLEGRRWAWVFGDIWGAVDRNRTSEMVKKKGTKKMFAETSKILLVERI